jgi:hypothetical protein
MKNEEELLADLHTIFHDIELIMSKNKMAVYPIVCRKKNEVEKIICRFQRHHFPGYERFSVDSYLIKTMKEFGEEYNFYFEYWSTSGFMYFQIFLESLEIKFKTE